MRFLNAERIRSYTNCATDGQLRHFLDRVAHNYIMDRTDKTRSVFALGSADDPSNLKARGSRLGGRWRAGHPEFGLEL